MRNAFQSDWGFLILAVGEKDFSSSSPSFGLNRGGKRLEKDPLFELRISGTLRWHPLVCRREEGGESGVEASEEKGPYIHSGKRGKGGKKGTSGDGSGEKRNEASWEFPFAFAAAAKEKEGGAQDLSFLQVV